MLTERPPVDLELRREFFRSDRLSEMEVPNDERLQSPARSIEAAMASGTTTGVRQACEKFLAAASEFYKVPRPGIRVLAARPLRVREGGWSTELFGDYTPPTGVIRIWMRTAVRKRVTSFGTLFSTLCHEFCHHLDYTRYRFRDSAHTRGFYERAAVLYHHARGTPRKRLVWVTLPGERWRIDWQRTSRGSPQ